MYTTLIICGLLASAAAAATPDDTQARVSKYEHENDGKGNYRFSFETTNGISREEIGRLVNIGERDEHIFVEGTYSYFDTNGDKVTINYTADENGYQIREPQKGLPEPAFIGYAEVSPNLLASLLG